MSTSPAVVHSFLGNSTDSAVSLALDSTFGMNCLTLKDSVQPIKINIKSTAPPHLLSATVRVYSLVAPCRLPDLTSLALLGSVSGQHRLSRGLLPGYKTISKWRLQLQDSTPFPLLSQSFAPLYTPQHLWDVISCLLSCQTAPWHLLVKSDSSNLCFC